MSLKDTVKLAPQLGLDHVIKSMVPSNYSIDDHNMITSFPTYFTNLSSLLDKTPKETVQSFLIWKLITSRAALFEGAGTAVDPYLRFRKTLNGVVSFHGLVRLLSLST
jgi:endothelin-converting enzyme